MSQVAAWMQAGDLADGLGQRIGRTIGGLRCQGQQSRAKLADEPRRAVATAGPGPIGGAEAIQHDGQAGGCDAGPVLILGLRAACLGGDGGVHQARVSARYSGVTRSLLTTWRVWGSNGQRRRAERRRGRTPPYSSSRCPPRWCMAPPLPGAWMPAKY